MTRSVYIILCVIFIVIQSTAQLSCELGEVEDRCPNDCWSDKCPTEEHEFRSCTATRDCGTPRCKCRFNTKRAINGTCIDTRECPPFKCNRQNEEYTPCPPYCPTDDCNQSSPDGRCPLFGNILIVLECTPACRCKKGYWRHEGKCVPYNECPDRCPPREMYSECIQAVCRAQECISKNWPLGCPAVALGSCLKGCICIEDYLRDESGTCIPEDDCIANPCQPNEEYSTCTQAVCRAQNCSQLGMPIDCPDIAEGECLEGCVCQEGYVRTEDGYCLLPDQCSVYTQSSYKAEHCSQNGIVIVCPRALDEDALYNCSDRVNEEYNPCPALCPTEECTMERVLGRCSFRIDTAVLVQCIPKCQCKEDYGRVNGTCVPFSKCPVLCPINERYSSCIQESCEPHDCAEINNFYLKPCPKVEKSICIKGCVCKLNYFRNEEGVCVSRDECDAVKYEADPMMVQSKNEGITENIMPLLEFLSNKQSSESKWYQ